MRLDKQLTPTDLLLAGGLVMVLLAGTAVRVLYPHSALGSFLATPAGIAVALAGTWLGFIAVSVLVRLSGRHNAQTPTAPDT